MSVYEDRSASCWIMSCRFKDINGLSKRTTKRGFRTKEEAEKWERELKAGSGLKTLALSEFFRVYGRDIRPTVVENTWEKKTTIYHDTIDLYLGSAFIEELSTPDVLLRQDLMRSMREKDSTRYSPIEGHKQPA